MLIDITNIFNEVRHRLQQISELYGTHLGPATLYDNDRWRIQTFQSLFCIEKNTMTYYALMTHAVKVYDRLRLIRSVLRASKLFVCKIVEIVILRVSYTIPFGFSLF